MEYDIDLFTNEYSDLFFSELAKVEDISGDIETYYHFTDINSFLSIVDAKTFWATNCCYLNDKREIDRVFNAILSELIDTQMDLTGAERADLEEFFAGLIEYHKERIFIVSFTSNANSIPLWEIYSKGNGLCLAFDSMPLNSKIQESAEAKHEFSADIYKVVYNKEIVVKIAKDVIGIYKDRIRALIDKNQHSKNTLDTELTYELSKLTSMLIQASAITKDSEFAYEYEVRAIIINHTNENIKFRSTGDSIKPYIEVKLGSTELKNVLISPKNLSETSLDGIKLFLKHHALGEVSVLRHISDYR